MNSNGSRTFGAAIWDDWHLFGHHPDDGRLGQSVASVPLVLLLIVVLLLAACQSSDPGGGVANQAERDLTTFRGYPGLGTVPPRPSPGYPTEERRQIVRDLVDDRDKARHDNAIIRHRSGLRQDPPPVAPDITELRPEDVIPRLPGEQQGPLDASSAEQDAATTAYGDQRRFNDGTLSDFIQQLEQDTTPKKAAVPESPNAANPEDTDAEDDAGQSEQQSSNHHDDPEPWLVADGRLFGPGLAIVPASFAPVLQPSNLPSSMLLVAGQEDSGFFCSYFGWMVAWSNACLSAQESEETNANVDNSEQSGDSGSSTPEDQLAPEDQPGSEERRTEADGTSEGGNNEQVPGKDVNADSTAPSDDVGDGSGLTSEDIGDGSLLVVTSLMDRLRDFLRSPRQLTNTQSGIPRVTGSTPAAGPLPKTPISRPKIEQDVEVVRHGRVYDFSRTQRPAYKPTPREPEGGIFRANGQKGFVTPVPRPPKVKGNPGLVLQVPIPPEPRPEPIVPRSYPAVPRPDPVAKVPRDSTEKVQVSVAEEPRSPDRQVMQKDLPEQPLEEQNAAKGGVDETELAAKDLDAVKRPVVKPSSPDSRILPLTADDEGLPVSEVILFDPNSAELPIGVDAVLQVLLDDAKARDRKIYIVGEAKMPHLALARARNVGLALVHLGATAELLEFDVANRGQEDQVRLLLKPGELETLPN
ncbi:MAG: hypothetical protein ACR2Q4_13335 [Geminicoccaceae bacterium]